MKRDTSGTEDCQLSCLVCNRDYELPRRYMRKAGDFDFSPIPRLLPCLHSLCHSCLTEQIEQQHSDQHIECVLCHHRDVVKSINHLPLDITTLKHIVSTNSSELMSVCSRCYDGVPSVSWCETCSSALCEFHHQDHKLSVDTAKHAVLTFKEYLYQGKHIDFKFPPLPCPEIPMQDCSLYCQTCLHSISPKAFIDFHKDHEVKDILKCFPEMLQAVDDSITQSTVYSQRLQDKIKQIKHDLYELDHQEEQSLLGLAKTFNAIHSLLKKREKELNDRLTLAMNKNRKQLLDQLSMFVDLHEECNTVINLSKNMIRDTRDTEVEGMYLIAASDTIEFRSDSLAEQIDEKMKSIPSIDPKCRIDIIEEDLQALNGLIARLGGVVIEEEEKTKMYTIDGKKKHNNGEDMKDFDDEKADDDDDSITNEIYFTVLVDDTNDGRQHAMKKNSSKVSVGGGGGSSNLHEHTIVIEARLRTQTSLESSRQESKRGKVLGKATKEQCNMDISYFR